MNFTLDNFSISSNCSVIPSELIQCYSSSCAIFIVISGIIVCVLVLPFNIWALFLSRKRMTMNDILNINMFCSCVIQCLAYIPYFFMPMVQSFTTILTFFDLIGFLAQVQFHCWICIEHCLAVVFPIFYLKLKRFRYKLVWVGFTWTSCLIFIGLNAPLNFIVPFLSFPLPINVMISVILICNLATLAVLRQPSPGNGERREMHLLKVKAFKIITLILIVLAVGYYPTLCMPLLEKSLSSEHFCIVKIIAFWLFLPGSIVHSLLYLSKLKMIPCSSFI